MEHSKLNSIHLPFWYKLNIDDHSNVLLKYYELLILYISCQVVVWRSLGIVCWVSGVPWCWLWSCRFVDSWLFFGRLLVCTQVSCLSVVLQSIRLLLEGCFTLVKSSRIYTGQYTFPILLLNDDNMLGEHKWREKNIVYGRLF